MLAAAIGLTRRAKHWQDAIVAVNSDSTGAYEPARPAPTL